MQQYIDQLKSFWDNFKRQPYWYLLPAIVFLLPYERIPSAQIADTTVRLSQIAAALLIIISIPWLVRNYKKLLRLPYLWLSLFVGSYFVSTLLAGNRATSAKVFIFTVFTMLVGILFSFFIRQKDLGRLQKALFLTTWVVIIFGLFQYAGDLLGLSTKLTGLAPNYVKDIFGYPRIQSTALEPLYLANFMLIPYLLLAADWILGKRHHPWLFFFSILLIILTVSRGGIIGGVVGLVAIILGAILLHKFNWRGCLSILGIVIAASAMAFAMTRIPANSKGLRDKSLLDANKRSHRLASQAFNLDSQDDRVRNRTLAIEAFKTAPAFGIGPGNFSDYAKQNYKPYEKEDKIIVNNEELEVLAEGGLVGIVLLLTFFGNIVYLFLRVIGKASTQLLPWIGGLSAYLIATVIQYQTFSTLYIMHIWVAIGILLAVITLAHTNHVKAGANAKVRDS